MEGRVEKMKEEGMEGGVGREKRKLKKDRLRSGEGKVWWERDRWRSGNGWMKECGG